MAAGAYPIPLYRSAVDGLVMPTAYDHRRLLNRRPLPALRQPLVLPSFRTPYVSPIAPIHAHILRSSSGFNIVRVPNAAPRTLRTSFLPSTNPRWNSPIIMMDSISRSIGHEKIFMSRMPLTRSESLRVPSVHLGNHAAMPRGELDARHFCGLAPIPEDKSHARQRSDIRPFTFAHRR